jgi:hypothetical protein
MPPVEHRPNLLLQALPEAEFEALRLHLEVVNLENHAILIANGALATHVYLPHAGAVSVVTARQEQLIKKPH